MNCSKIGCDKDAVFRIESRVPNGPTKHRCLKHGAQIATRDPSRVTRING